MLFFFFFFWPLKLAWAGRNRWRCLVHLQDWKILSCRSLLKTEHRGCTRLFEQMFQYLSRVTSCCWWRCGYWPLGGKDPSMRLSDEPVLDCSLLQWEIRTELESFLWWESVVILTSGENQADPEDCCGWVLQTQAVTDHILHPYSSCT